MYWHFHLYICSIWAYSKLSFIFHCSCILQASPYNRNLIVITILSYHPEENIHTSYLVMNFYLYFTICFFFSVGTFPVVFSMSIKLLFKNKCTNWHVVVVQSLNHVRLFATPWITACQVSLSVTISQSLLKLMSKESVMLFNHLITILIPLLLLHSVFPSNRVFSSEPALHIRWPKYRSFSISPPNEYSGLISFRIDWFNTLQTKGLSRVLSSTTTWKHQFFGTKPSLWSNFHIRMWLLEKP